MHGVRPEICGRAVTQKRDVKAEEKQGGVSKEVLRLCRAQPALHIPKSGGRKSQQHQYSQQQAQQARVNMEKYRFHLGKICSYIMLNIANWSETRPLCSFQISQRCSSHSFLIPHGHRGAEYTKPYLSWGFHQHQELWLKVHLYFRANTATCVPWPLQGKPDLIFTQKPGGRRVMWKELFFHLCLILNESKHSNCYLRKTSSTEGDFLLNSFDFLLEKKE